MPRLTTAITIGSFDGVHRGHAALLRRARELVDTPASRGRVVAMSFDPHPLSKLRPEAVPPRLTTFERREQLLVENGADEVVRLTPEHELLSKSPDEFMRWVTHAFHPSFIVEGPDFRFGKGRTGDVETLRSLGAVMNFKASIVEPVEVDLSDQLIAKASSTMVRWLVVQGRASDAAIMLGRPFELPGSVTAGDRMGRTIGFPTANILPHCMVPADGVYASTATLADGRVFGAAVSIGTRPTFKGTDRRVEVYLLDAPMSKGPAIDGLPEYGWTMTIRFIAWVRDQVRFESIDRLVEQMKRDCERVRRIVDVYGADTVETALPVESR